MTSETSKWQSLSPKTYPSAPRCRQSLSLCCEIHLNLWLQAFPNPQPYPTPSLSTLPILLVGMAQPSAPLGFLTMTLAVDSGAWVLQHYSIGLVSVGLVRHTLDHRGTVSPHASGVILVRLVVDGCCLRLSSCGGCLGGPESGRRLALLWCREKHQGNEDDQRQDVEIEIQRSAGEKNSVV